MPTTNPRISWALEYADGRRLDQFDAAAPGFDSVGGEVPFRAIDWAGVQRLQFSVDGRTWSYGIQQQPGTTLMLRSRWTRTPSGRQYPVYMLVTVDASQSYSVDDVASLRAATQQVTYWGPDGLNHLCPHFQCPDIDAYATKMVHWQPHQPIPVMPPTIHQPWSERTSMES